MNSGEMLIDFSENIFSQSLTGGDIASRKQHTRNQTGRLGSIIFNTEKHHESSTNGSVTASGFDNSLTKRVNLSGQSLIRKRITMQQTNYTTKK